MSKLTLDETELKKVIMEALKEKLASAINYQEMHSLIGDVIEQRRDEVQALLLDCLDGVLADESMKDVIREEFKHKVAKNMVGKLEGAVEKSVNAFRQNPTMNAKMILALEEIIKDGSNHAD